NGDAGRRRNVETRGLGWSGFAVTPTTQEATPFARLVDLTTKLEATSKSLEKRALLAAFLKSLRRDEVAPAVHLIVGRIFAESDSRALNVGWATLKKALTGTKQATLVPRPLTILEATRMFAQIAEARGPDSTRTRRRLLESLLGRASEEERDVLLRNVFGEMRIGVNEGVMLEGIADAAGVEADSVRTAHMFLGDLGLVAEIALFEGAPGLRSRGLRLLAPMKPMLAEMAEDLDEVLREHGGQTAIEYKLDGARIQIHRRGNAVRIFSRRLSDVTDSLPEIVAIAKALDSTYSVGKRGKKWFKIKPADRLDMAIVAAEWGSGRREGWLSNYWLAVRDDASDSFQMIGKTFKGLTDAEFETMTERLRGLATSEERWGFHVRPDVVVEVAYNEIQRSPHYPSGFALRFARIVRVRDDKGSADVDTYARLKELYAKQFERKGRGPEDL